MKLKNKVAIVTGSGRGIGRAIALELAREGVKVVVTSRHTEECDEVCSVINADGGESLCVECDVSKKEDIDRLVKETMDKFGRIDILVSNAGVVRQNPISETSEEDWDFVLDINLKGMFLVCKAVAPIMIEQKSGKIVSIASIAGEIGFPNTSAYCASKGGIVNLTRELALEMAPYNVNVNAVAPGVIETSMTEGMLADENSRKGLLTQIPMGRVGKSEEIAKAVLFLASDDSSYVTGHTLVVDGGWVAQ